MRRLALLFTLAACARGDSITLSAPQTVSAPTTVGAAPMFAVAPDGAHTLAWVSAPDSGTDGRLFVLTRAADDHTSDPPSELRDPLGPIEPHGEAPPKVAYGRDGTLYALYAVGKLVPGRRFPASALRVARSADGGRTWSAPKTVAMDSSARDDFAASRNFHALHVAADGSLYAAWLESSSHRGSGTFITRSSDGGDTWTPAVRVDAGESCPCCRTAIATADDGTLYLAWRAVLPGNVRDIVVARSSDHGATWAAPERVHADNWAIDACPHAGPSMQVDGSGRVHIAWWTGMEGAAGVYYARSTDGARTFSTPIAMRTAESSSPSHVQLALNGEAEVLVAWDDGTVRTPRVLLRMSRDGGGTFGEATIVSDESRAATFPVLAAGGNTITVGWSEQAPATHAAAEASRMHMKDPSATMGLPAVGATRIVVRSGRI